MKKVYFLLLGFFLFNGVNAQVISIPDANFKTKLINLGIDINSDGQIQLSEALNRTDLSLESSSISSLIGIEYFSNLSYLRCDSNSLNEINLSGLNKLQNLNCDFNNITSLNLSGCFNLETLSCFENQLTSLNVSGFSNLKNLSCGENNLTTLDVSGCVNLLTLGCVENNLITLNLSGLVNLQNVYCSKNQLTTLDVSGFSNLLNLECDQNQIMNLNLNNSKNIQKLMCFANQLTDLDLSGMTNLTTLFCKNNQLTILNMEHCHKLQSLACEENQLVSMIIKNGSFFEGSEAYTTLDFGGNPNLQFICADDSELEWVQGKCDLFGNTNCVVNSYCSFTPGGKFYTIQGNNKLDSNNNGCDSLDIIYPKLNFTITDGTVSGSIISNSTSDYYITVGEGTQTITPTLETPSYFNISPTNITVTFPTQTSPFIQDFCVTANGAHPDLEVALLPTVPARPGFDAKYSIIYKNKGNQTQSGYVNLTFDDAVLDFVSANPVTTNQTINNLSWNFTNLLPFETREITLTLNVNSPTETPAVNIGYQLNFRAEINPISGDETPYDNVGSIKQIVVGSFDPNDKTCLEGTTISPTMVGEYVHYLIRFENTGTFPAENIVVKDMIDLAKFDINTLVPIKGSHEFVTNITAGNKVEFIFENINLPFDDANNDGFVAFKIKTKSSLVLGDTFTNSANIYFDYNFPIVTNTATTTVQTLGKQDFDFAKYFIVYPNPASSTLNLDVKSGIVVNSIAIYNILGQLVIAIPNAQTVSNIDVSNLKTGNYFIKMTTDKGTANTKFIKN